MTTNGEARSHRCGQRAVMERFARKKALRDITEEAAKACRAL